MTAFRILQGIRVALEVRIAFYRIASAWSGFGVSDVGPSGVHDRSTDDGSEAFQHVAVRVQACSWEALY